MIKMLLINYYNIYNKIGNKVYKKLKLNNKVNIK